MEKLESEEKNMTTYDELVARGLIAQVTDEEEIRELERVPATIIWTPESPVQAWVRWEQDVS